MGIIEQELERLGVIYGALEPIRERDGVHVARVRRAGGTLIIKAFEGGGQSREIGNYAVLRSLGVPTLRVLGSTDRALLLEDLEGGGYRPGRPEDLDDPEAAALIARWYRELHGRGYAHVESAGEGLYDENDALTAENIEAVRARTGELPVWRLIEANWGRIRAAIDGARRTLTYNDFYYTNLAVARDGSSALMFDYGLLGKGYAYADIRNVLSSLSPAAGEAFLAGYGPFDAREEQIDGVANVLLGLCQAYGRAAPPPWAEALLAELRGDMYARVERLIGE